MKLKTLLLLLMLVYVVAPAHASNAGSCYSISDGDARNYCLAKARKEPGMCYSIHKADMRSMCLAEVSREKTH